jgi:hypothetical protein
LLKGQADKSPNSLVESTLNSPIKKSDGNNSDVRSKSNVRSDATPQSSRGISEVEENYDWREEQNDQEHYWRMCKNEKINLLLKRR